MGKLFLGHFLSCRKIQNSEISSLRGKQIPGACVPAPNIGFMMPTFRFHLVPVTGPQRLLKRSLEGRPHLFDRDGGTVPATARPLELPGGQGQGSGTCPQPHPRLGQPLCTWHTDIYGERIQAQLQGPDWNHRVSGSRICFKLDESQPVTPNQSQWAKTRCLMLSSGTCQGISGLRPLLGSRGCPHTGFLYRGC